MIITLPLPQAEVFDVPHFYTLLRGAVEHLSEHYDGNIMLDPGKGIITKLLNSVRLRVEIDLKVKDPKGKGAAILNGERQGYASPSANAKMVTTLHAIWPTAVVQVGNIYYQAKAIPPPKRVPAPVTTKPVVTVPATPLPAAVPAVPALESAQPATETTPAAEAWRKAYTPAELAEIDAWEGVAIGHGYLGD